MNIVYRFVVSFFFLGASDLLGEEEEEAFAYLNP